MEITIRRSKDKTLEMGKAPREKESSEEVRVAERSEAGRGRSEGARSQLNESLSATDLALLHHALSPSANSLQTLTVPESSGDHLGARQAGSP